MQTYEFTLVLTPEVSADKKAREAHLKGLLGDQVTYTSVDVWGKKRLAYPIKKQGEGVYVHAVVKGTLKTGVIEQKVKLDNTVLRYLLVGVDGTETN
jgi:small subunit ribosomal protein S6